MGYLIAIDGLDGSGKETQANLLANAIKKCGKNVRLLSFPVYESESSSLVRLYLNGKLGSSPGDTNAFAASVFFACDRYISFVNDWKKDRIDPKTVLIANRYTTANAVHQLSKLPKREWDSFLEWLFDFEYNKLGIPAPDKVFYLKCSPTVSMELIRKRSASDHRALDIHEKDEDYLIRCYEAAVYSANQLNWDVISCDDENGMREREAIHAEILKKLSGMII